MRHELHSPIEQERLKQFAERYQELANILLYYDNDTMMAIDAAEAELLKRAFLGINSQNSEEKIKLRYARERTRIIAENLQKNANLRKIGNELKSLMQTSPYEMQLLGLSYNKSLPLAAVIYSNYYFIKEQMPSLNVRLGHNK